MYPRPGTTGDRAVEPTPTVSAGDCDYSLDRDPPVFEHVGRLDGIDLVERLVADVEDRHLQVPAVLRKPIDVFCPVVRPVRVSVDWYEYLIHYD